ncbi:MAG: hypothetical protein COZ70_02405 [Deltaproteobacteria bacterium CG_4_8_14_3_um_filter_51_11]|nr:CpsD/CapB family tyrosine-protein kinase [bacterium]OIP43245.1 MAG: hypothetical protein AUK25_01730 [Desulfobacteraceae bacterium CG2_30_51_40]PIX20663.1 MAG: hypothetical protein COZ70_02405 [Deltaproteobacteria bacterium CG_4_8_14_3_um_filter_51_11]PIY22481.1 MAG: hypothetical protein COZ11_12465 [Deltaproteobacteria bacterium CG_4_10_14_3_um_filter_51_14]PJB35238.1 MAG: hypothetical protein CO107_11130 [Deltaproteobacteria bacterium CG_4_9_14_3_um_filter_51_14]
MTKIYEALVNASEQVHSVQTAPADVKVKPVVTANSALDQVTDAEMVTLSHAIESLLPNKERKVIQFVGSKPREGVSTVSRGFATFSSVSMNKRVLLIDSDRKTTTQNHFFGVKNSIGWQEGVNIGADIQDVMMQIGGSSLFLWPSSNSSRISTGIFNPQAITALIETLRGQFDLVVVDSSPLAQSPDALALAPHVDGVLLVVEAENTRWRVVESTKDRLKACGANVLGVVFNKRRLHIPTFIYKRLR